MKRIFIAVLALAGVCDAKEWQPNEVEISIHRKEVYALARDYVIETFNLEIIEESVFNPVRFDSRGVWGNFDARIKELGGNRFEVKGWVNARGHDKAKVPWTVHVRYALVDPEGWRYRRVDEVFVNEPEFLGWKFGDYRSIGYEADYEASFVAGIYARSSR